MRYAAFADLAPADDCRARSSGSSEWAPTVRSFGGCMAKTLVREMEEREICLLTGALVPSMWEGATRPEGQLWGPPCDPCGGQGICTPARELDVAPTGTAGILSELEGCLGGAALAPLLRETRRPDDSAGAREGTGHAHSSVSGLPNPLPPLLSTGRGSLGSLASAWPTACPGPWLPQPVPWGSSMTGCSVCALLLLLIPRDCDRLALELPQCG